MSCVASVRPELGRIKNARSDFLCPIQFHSCKEGLDRLAQNQPGSNLDGLAKLWPYRSGLEACWCARIIGPTSGRTQLTCYQFPTFRLGCVLPPATVQSWCVQESPGPPLASASKLIQIGRRSDPACLPGYCESGEADKKIRVRVGLVTAEILFSNFLLLFRSFFF